MDRVRDHLTEGARAGQRYAVGLPRTTRLGQIGSSVGQRAGSSLEFRDYREYQPGDDLRHVDWNAYARSDQLSIKLFREEITPHADILLDVTRSMMLEDSQKERASLALAAFVATAAENAGFSFQAWRVSDTIEPIEQGNGPPALWEGLALETVANPASAFARWTRRRPRGLRFLISDLLFEGDPLSVLRPLSDQAAGVVVVQLLAREDEQPQFAGNVRLVDSETGDIRELHVDERVLRRYRDNLRRHQTAWHDACRQAGAVFTAVVAETLLNEWRLDDLVAAEVLKVV